MDAERIGLRMYTSSLELSNLTDNMEKGYVRQETDLDVLSYREIADSMCNASWSLENPQLELNIYDDHHDSLDIASSASTITAENYKAPNMSLPSKRFGHFWRNIRWTLFSVYRRLNLLVLLPNVISMIVLGAQRNLFTSSPQNTATAVSINLTVAVLIRQELVINFLFTVFGKCPPSFPLRIRCLAAKIYHLGGVHSGAAIAATVWFGLYNVNIVRMVSKDTFVGSKTSITILTVCLDILLLSIIILAHPALRRKYHNAFEMVHRFAGWTSVALVWVQFGLVSDAVRRSQNPRPTISIVLLNSPSLYCLIVVTISLVLPWLRLRKVPVHPEPLSKHAIRLHFSYTNLPLCSGPRVSDSPLKEWHAFAGIPEDKGDGFSFIVSNAGDWTANIIRSPPTHLWVRGIPVRGVLHVAPIFKKIVLVATGSGIGPVLSLLNGHQTNCRILWSTPDPEKTYQKSIIENVLRVDPDAVIINTTQSGRPNLTQMAYELYRASEAEAIFVISNPKVSRTIVYRLESRGIPTFAPIFDS